LKGVVFLWALDVTWCEDRRSSELEDLQGIGCDSALHLLKALSTRTASANLPVWWVTRGACPVAGAVSSAGLAQAPVRGLGKVHLFGTSGP